jgi:hypothetical protein
VNRWPVWLGVATSALVLFLIVGAYREHEGRIDECAEMGGRLQSGRNIDLCIRDGLIVKSW